MSHIQPTLPDMTNKQFWTEFIELYKDQPCLWDMKSEDFNNETIRSLAYGLLLEKLWEIDPNADIDSVGNNLNSFRRYYKEHKKKEIEKSRSSNPIEPWFYSTYLDFLSSQEDCVPTIDNLEGSLDSNKQPGTAVQNKKPRRRRRIINKPPTISVTEIEKSMKNIVQPKETYDNIAVYEGTGNLSLENNVNQSEEDSLDNLMDSPVKPTAAIGISESDWDIEPPMKKPPPNEAVRQKFTNREIHVREKVTRENNKSLKEKADFDDVNKDDCATFADHLTTRMRAFDPEQKWIAQKLISDVMFLASTNQLNLNSAIALNKNS